MSGATQALLTGADVSVTSIACPGDGTTSVQELVGSSMYELCLVRSGSFLLRGSVVEGRAVEVFADPTVCLFGAPEHAVEVTHPRPGGDLDTCVFLSEDVCWPPSEESAGCLPCPLAPARSHGCTDVCSPCAGGKTRTH